jgi:hypothetical protein
MKQSIAKSRVISGSSAAKNEKVVGENEELIIKISYSRIVA